MSVQPAAAGPIDQLKYAGEVLSKNWILALPTALVSLVLCLVFVVGTLSVALAGFLGHAAGGRTGMWAGLGTGALVLALLVVAGIALLVFAQAIVIHAAEDAWQGRPLALGNSLGAAAARLPDLVVALGLSALIMIVPVALSFVLIGIPLVLVAAYFLMFVTPAVVIGRESGPAALATSFRLASQNVSTSLVAFLGIVGASVLGSFAAGLTSHIPLINVLVSFALGGLTAAYSALVAARFYDILRGAVPAGAAPLLTQPPMAPPPGSGPPTIIR